MIRKFFLCLLLLSSCTFISRKVESLATPDTKSTIQTHIKSAKKNLYCFDNNELQLLFEDDATIKYYRPFMPGLFENKNYSFTQKAAMLALIEMSRRPDEASPSARLQYFFRLNNKDYYFDFRPKNLEDDNKMPYIKGVETLLKNFDQSKNLLKLGDILDNSIPQSTNVSAEFESFLQTYKADIIKNDELTENFIKGDEVLTEHESFKRISFKKILASFYKDNLAKDSDYEFSKNALYLIESGHEDLNLKCNYDINKESSLKDDILFSEQKKSHSFALKEGNNFFIAVSSSVIQKPFKNLKTTYFIKSRSSPQPLPICQFKTNKQDIILFSTKGRNPTQHLKHLVSYDINLVDSYQSLEELLNFSRHLFLGHPDRILYESKRGRKSQLDFFLSMNFPIYHVDALGDIIGIANFKSQKTDEQSLIIDDRSLARLWCSP